MVSDPQRSFLGRLPLVAGCGEWEKCRADDPNLGAFTFRARSSWQDGTHNVGEISGFSHAGSDDQGRAAAHRLGSIALHATDEQPARGNRPRRR
jgi:hypothetical protein